MTCWQQHNEDIWIIENQQQQVVALVQCDSNTNLYTANKCGKPLGVYTTLQSAMQAATPKLTKLLEHKHTKFNAKTVETMPWDS